MINKNIRFIRTKNGYSQQALADKTGVNRGNINSYELNTRPKQEFLLAFVKLFDLDLTMLLSDRVTDDNYDRFRLDKKLSLDKKDPSIHPSGYKTSDFFQLMLKIKAEEDSAKRSRLVDQALSMVNQLEDENRALQIELRKSLRNLN